MRQRIQFGVARSDFNTRVSCLRTACARWARLPCAAEGQRQRNPHGPVSRRRPQGRQQRFHTPLARLPQVPDSPSFIVGPQKIEPTVGGDGLVYITFCNCPGRLLAFRILATDSASSTPCSRSHACSFRMST